MKQKANNQIKESIYFNGLTKEKGDIWWGNMTRAGKQRLHRKANLLFQDLNRYTDPNVLEIGCGVGAFSGYILQKKPLLRLSACDLSHECIKEATQRYRHYQNACFAIGDATCLQYNSNTFDAIIGNAILHHLPLEISLRECYRMLKAGGLLYFFEPNMMNPHIALEKNIRFIGQRLNNTEDETAFFRWSLTKTLRRGGFKNVAVKPFDFLHPITPSFLINIVGYLGRLLERTPILREIAGSLLITANKPDSSN